MIASLESLLSTYFVNFDLVSLRGSLEHPASPLKCFSIHYSNALTPFTIVVSESHIRSNGVAE